MSENDEYLSLFIKHNQHLFHFVLTLVPNYSDAEDIFQESAQIMWKKFDTYRKGTNFLAWARKIIRFKVSNYYRTVKQQFSFDEDIIAKVSAVQHEASKNFSEKKAALKGCLSKMTPSDLDLIQMRYTRNLTIQEIARQSNRSVFTLYRRISTIYALLQNCIRKTLIEWGLDA